MKLPNWSNPGLALTDGKVYSEAMTKDEFDSATGYNEYRTMRIAYLNTPISGTLRRAAPGESDRMFRLATYEGQSNRSANTFYYSDVLWIG